MGHSHQGGRNHPAGHMDQADTVEAGGNHSVVEAGIHLDVVEVDSLLAAEGAGSHPAGAGGRTPVVVPDLQAVDSKTLPTQKYP